MYTGGTTGLPKGVLLDQRAMTLTAYHAGDEVGATSPTRSTCCRPRCFTPPRSAASPSSRRSAAPRRSCPFFDPAVVIAAIPRFGVTNTVMVPTMIAMTMDHPDFTPETFGSLRRLTYGASPMPTALLDRLLADYPAARDLPGLRDDRGGGAADRASARKITSRARTGCTRPVRPCPASR